MKNEIVGRGWAFPPKVNAHGGVALATDRDEIDQAISIILSTFQGMRVMRPTFGCQLNDLVFAPNNPKTIAQARRYVEEALGMWEPRITVDKIDVHLSSRNDACLEIEIQYEVKATRDKRSLVHPFYLIPEESG